MNRSPVWNWFEGIVMFTTMLSIIVGVVAYTEERNARKEARLVNSQTLAEFKATSEERKIGSRLRAWEILTRPASGIAGKDWALSYLSSVGENLTGLDLSCEALRIDRSRFETCGAKFEFLRLNLSDANLRNSNFSGIGMHLIDFSGADLSYTNFDHTTLSGSNFTRADLDRSNLSGANIYSVIFDEAHISNVDFSGAQYSVDSVPSFKGSWAWDDQHPTGITGHSIMSCKPVFQNGHRIHGPAMKFKAECSPFNL